jgi:hypothetical protein
MPDLFKIDDKERIKELEALVAEKTIKINQLHQIIIDVAASSSGYQYWGKAAARKELKEKREADEREKRKESEKTQSSFDDILNEFRKMKGGKSRSLLDQLTEQVKKDFKAQTITIDDSNVIRNFIARFIHDN